MPEPIPTAAPHTHPDIPPFPSPSTFSILPDIYLLISRLSILQPVNPANASQQASTSTPAGTGAGTGVSASSARPTPTHPNDRLHSGQPPLETKDLIANIYPIKQKLAKARAAVAGLPDVQRSVDEQESEIRALEKRVAALNGRLALLAGIAKGEGKGDRELGPTPVDDVVMKEGSET